MRRERIRLHNKGLYVLYCSPNIIRVIKSRRMLWVGHVARMPERRSAYRVLVGISGGKRPFCRPRHRWEDNTKTDPQDGMGRYGLDCYGSDRDCWCALVNAVMNFWVP